MNLYRISQTVNDGYDTYDSAVVAAESEDAAKLISPDPYREWREGEWHFVFADGSSRTDDHYSWAHPSEVKAELIGTAKEGTEAGVITASFNAG